jgi:hypothetical protein
VLGGVKVWVVILHGVVDGEQIVELKVLVVGSNHLAVTDAFSLDITTVGELALLGR